MADFFNTYRQQGQRENVFSHLDHPMTLEEASMLAETFDEWEAEMLILRLCHPAAFGALQHLIRRN